MKIKITCLKKPISKLKFVKAIKMVTNLGLKDSKDKADFLFDNLGSSVDIELVEDLERTDNLRSIDYLRKELDECGGESKLTGGLEWERNLKMLSLGLGESQEYVDFLSEYLKYNHESIIKPLLNKLSKQDLIDLTNKI